MLRSSRKLLQISAPPPLSPTTPHSHSPNASNAPPHSPSSSPAAAGPLVAVASSHHQRPPPSPASGQPLRQDDPRLALRAHQAHVRRLSSSSNNSQSRQSSQGNPSLPGLSGVSGGGSSASSGGVISVSAVPGLGSAFGGFGCVPNSAAAQFPTPPAPELVLRRRSFGSSPSNSATSSSSPSPRRSPRVSFSSSASASASGDEFSRLYNGNDNYKQQQQPQMQQQQQQQRQPSQGQGLTSPGRAPGRPGLRLPTQQQQSQSQQQQQGHYPVYMHPDSPVASAPRRRQASNNTHGNNHNGNGAMTRRNASMQSPMAAQALHLQAAAKMAAAANNNNHLDDEDDDDDDDGDLRVPRFQLPDDSVDDADPIHSKNHKAYAAGEYSSDDEMADDSHAPGQVVDAAASRERARRSRMRAGATGQYLQRTAQPVGAGAVASAAVLAHQGGQSAQVVHGAHTAHAGTHGRARRGSQPRDHLVHEAAAAASGHPPEEERVVKNLLLSPNYSLQPAAADLANRMVVDHGDPDQDRAHGRAVQDEQEGVHHRDQQAMTDEEDQQLQVRNQAALEAARQRYGRRYQPRHVDVDRSSPAHVRGTGQHAHHAEYDAHAEQYDAEADASAAYYDQQHALKHAQQHGVHEEEDEAYEDEFDGDEEDEFDPFLFIKYLPPPPPEARQRVSPLPRPTTDKVCLALDLDETLVHCSVDPIDDYDITFDVEFNGQTFVLYVRKRPHLEHFLREVSQWFEVVVFTASQQVYADKLLDFLDPRRELIQHRVFRDSCVCHEGNYLKDLHILGRELHRVAIIDNSVQAFGYQVDNGIPIESWYDDTEDQELLNLLPLLHQLKDEPDTRPLIRRTFRLRDYIDALQPVNSNSRRQRVFPGRD